MTTTLKQVLLEVGGHGTVPFVIGSEQRPIHGYPLVMAARSKLMAATDWTSQMRDAAAEPHHLLAEQHLTDEQWALFQALWLYAHADDRAFDGVHCSAAIAEQLRGYLGVEDSPTFRIATQQPPAVRHELDRRFESFDDLLKQVAALPEEQMYDAVKEYDAALEEWGWPLNEDTLIEVVWNMLPVAKLVVPLPDRHGHARWSFRGQLAKYMPSYIRQWLNEGVASWNLNSKNNTIEACLGYEGTFWTAVSFTEVVEKTTVSRWDSTLWPETFLVPHSTQRRGEPRHTLTGLARGMLYTPTVDDDNKLSIGQHTVRGEGAWDELVQQHHPLIVLAELLCEVVTLGRRLRICLSIDQLTKHLERRNIRADKHEQLIVKLRQALSDIG